MLKSVSYIKLIVLTAFTFVGTFSSIAQRDPKIDTLLKQAKLKIYETPENVIKLGDSLYNSPEASTETKVDALILISDAYSSKRDYEKSLKYFYIANELTKKENNIDLQILVLGRTAIRYQQMKVYDKAIQYLDECDRLLASDQSKKDNRYTKGNNHVVRGLIYKEQLNCDIAINYFKKGIQEYELINSSVKFANESIAYYNMGNCYVSLSDFPKAKESFDKAVISADKIDAKSLKAFALKGLSEVYYAERNYEKAIAVLHEALEISKGVGDLILNRGLYINLADNYKATGNWTEYQKYNHLFLKNQSIIKDSERQSISDSIKELGTVNDNKLEQMQLRYYIVISLEILLSLFFVYMLISYQKRSLKSINGFNLEIKKIKEGFKKGISD
jgi:tetratricopeptide (TPR) repeat protein